MEVWASAMARAEAWAKSYEERITRALTKFGIGGTGDDVRRHDDPITILKRLQRETFYELMKLRDRQEKLERILTFNKTGKGSPFQETRGPTRLKGIVSAAGALPFLNIAGIKTGVDSRFIFETVTRERDTLVAELAARQDTSFAHFGNVTGSPLTLSRVAYLANINDWLSLVTLPFGARCQDFSLDYQPLQGSMWPSSFDPPLLHQFLGCAFGLSLKCSSIAAAASQSVSSQFNSFGQVDLQVFEGAKVSLMGLWQLPRQQSRVLQMSPLEPNSSGLGAVNSWSSGSAAVVLESELDESSRIRGWVELLRSSEQSVQWGVSLLDAPEEEIGWGLAIGGRTGSDHKRWVQFEGFLNFCIGKRLTLRPSLVYSVDGRAHNPAVVVSSSWTL